MTDPLSSLVESLHLHARILYIGGACGPWRMDIAAPGLASFHLIVRGEAWLTTGQTPEPRLLRAGDLVLFPREIPHGLSGAPGGCDVMDPRLLVGTGEGDSDVLCGTIELTAGHDHPLVRALPPEVLLSEMEQEPRLSALVKLMQQEVQMDEPGRDAMVARLAETLFVLAARECMRGEGATGALAGLADPRLRKAMVAMHKELAHPWTLQSLAQAAGMSRTSFAEAFSLRVGTTAMDYLLHWRMRMAATLLKEGHQPVEAVAAKVGYESVASFIRAFTRVHGITPGRYARQLPPL